MTEPVGIVVPAYRPDVGVLTEYVAALTDRIGPETIRIELDAPADGVREQLADLPATVNTVDARRGKGAAITAGFEALETETLAFVDADGSTPAPEVGRIVATPLEDPVDLAVGSRRHPDATVTTTQSPVRESLGDGFAWLARRCLEVQLYDYQCGAKAITAEGWQQVRRELTEPGFAWDIELLAVASAVGLRVQEVPIEWHDHPESTVAPVRTSIQLASALVRARQRARRRDASALQRVLNRVVDSQQSLVERNVPPQDDD
ncbi:MAG: glycosyltransferase [Halovenus sp.]